MGKLPNFYRPKTMIQSHAFIFISIIATALSQLSFKFGSKTFSPPTMDSVKNIFLFIYQMITNIYLFGGLVLGFVAAMSWALALKKFELSYAYPFTALSMIMVILSSSLIFKENLTAPKVIGTSLIVFGLLIIAR